MRILLIQPPFPQLKPLSRRPLLDRFLRVRAMKTKVQDHSLGLYRRHHDPAKAFGRIFGTPATARGGNTPGPGHPATGGAVFLLPGTIRFLGRTSCALLSRRPSLRSVYPGFRRSALGSIPEVHGGADGCPGRRRPGLAIHILDDLDDFLHTAWTRTSARCATPSG